MRVNLVDRSIDRLKELNHLITEEPSGGRTIEMLEERVRIERRINMDLLYIRRVAQGWAFGVPNFL